MSDLQCSECHETIRVLEGEDCVVFKRPAPEGHPIIYLIFHKETDPEGKNCYTRYQEKH